MKVVQEIEEIISKLRYMQNSGIKRLVSELMCMVVVTLLLGWILGIMSMKFLVFSLVSSVVYLITLLIKVLKL